MITKVFPDEYHLHTLDSMLSAIARLNPHVDLKEIVIGLMDRLSTYATRDSDSMSLEARKQAEEEATVQLLERLRLSKEAKETAQSAEQPEPQQNGTTEPDAAEKPKEDVSENEQEPSKEPEANTEDGESKVTLPGDIKLYEIFYDQVVNLVKARGLPIQDTIALLVSLANLAM